MLSLALSLSLASSRLPTFPPSKKGNEDLDPVFHQRIGPRFRREGEDRIPERAELRLRPHFRLLWLHPRPRRTRVWPFHGASAACRHALDQDARGIGGRVLRRTGAGLGEGASRSLSAFRVSTRVLTTRYTTLTPTTLPIHDSHLHSPRSAHSP